MSAEHGDRWKLLGKTMRLGGIAWIALAAAGMITGATLAQLVVIGAVGSLLGSAIENREKFFGKPHAATAAHH